MERAEFRAIGKGTRDNPAQIRASFTPEGLLYELTGLGSVLEQVYCSIQVSAEKMGKDLCGSGGFVTLSSLGTEYVDRFRNAGVKMEVVGLV
ncbi:Saccharopine dehydrogenase / Homospermidine synthase [Penicillium canescens]|nr:Saccharopine dehydrogenase / Homospermidine synthase [Penicillium canescens]